MQNLLLYFYPGSGTELMVWYGDDYGKELGLMPLVQQQLLPQGE